VLFHYPKQMFNLYVHIKSRMIEHVLTQAWNYLFALGRAPVSGNLFAIAAAQSVLFVSFIISVTAAGMTVVDRRLIIFPVFFVFSMAPLYVAAANSSTTADTVFLMYACLVLAILLAMQLAVKALAPGLMKTSK
jgi:hypothetical protein